MLAEHGETGEGEFLWPRGSSEEYVRAKAIAPEVTLDVVANFYRLHHPLTEKAKVGPLVEEFIEEWEDGDSSKRHLSDLKFRLRRFAQEFGERYPDTFSRNEIIQYIRRTATVPRTRKNFRAALSNFFNWLAEEEIIPSTPAAKIPQRKLGKIPRNKIKFFKLDQVERYRRAAERYDPDLVAHEIVQLMAGVRSDDEMARLPIKILLSLPESKAARGKWPWNSRRRTFCSYHVAMHQLP